MHGCSGPHLSQGYGDSGGGDGARQRGSVGVVRQGSGEARQRRGEESQGSNDERQGRVGSDGGDGGGGGGGGVRHSCGGDGGSVNQMKCM